MSSSELPGAPQGASEERIPPGNLLRQHALQLMALGAFIGAAGAMSASFDADVAANRALWMPGPAPSPFRSGALGGMFFGPFFGFLIGLVASVRSDGRLCGRTVPRLLIGVLAGLAVGALLGGAGATVAHLLGPPAAAWVSRWPLFAFKDLRQGLPLLIGGAVGALVTAGLVGVALRLVAGPASPDAAGGAGAETGSSSLELTIGGFTLTLDSSRRLLKQLLLPALVLVVGALWQYWKQEQEHPERSRSQRQQMAVLVARMGVVECLAFSGDGRILAAAGWPASWISMPSRITLWEMPRGRERASITTGHTYPVQCLALTPDGRTLVSMSGDSVRLWEVDSGRERTVLYPPSKKIYFSSMDVSPDGRLLAVGSGSRGAGGRIYLWDLPSLKSRPALRAPGGGSVGPVAFSPDGRTLAAGLKRHVYLWDRRRLTTAGVLRGHPYEVQRLAFSADGRTLVTTGYHPSVLVWNLATQKLRAKLNHGARISEALLSADGATLITARHDRGLLHRWEVASRRELEPLENWVPGSGTTSSSVSALVSAPDGRSFASASFENVILWGSGRSTVGGTIAPVVNKN